jgi:hypothetical protein
MDTPVVLIIFNRPNTTKIVLDCVRKVKPPKLFVIADGPRQHRPDEEEKCAATRQLIEHVDWDCQVLTNYSDINLGCKYRISSGIDWVFEQTEEAIILEDDCLPHESFFPFCEELLDKYRNDQRITTISGNNFQFGRQSREFSYYFSRYPLIWGWATWRRAWQHYDVEMKPWEILRDGHWLEDILNDSKSVKYWSRIFQCCHDDKIDTWDFPLTLTSWIQNGLNIIPNVNLVSNIGFGPDALTTKDTDSNFANHPTAPMKFPLKHPPFMIRDAQADQFTQYTQFDHSFISKAKSKVKKIFSSKKINTFR